ncbi:hypothetical protein ABT340_19475 [Streptosporangium sp. NPDC000239]|uniref:hypothetical protein n=1 Tax=Streptosporangium sp. NPDC000239 TaxID=3154248 RepID=UPI00332BDC6B
MDTEEPPGQATDARELAGATPFSVAFVASSTCVTGATDVALAIVGVAIMPSAIAQATRIPRAGRPDNERGVRKVLPFTGELPFNERTAAGSSQNRHKRQNSDHSA